MADPMEVALLGSVPADRTKFPRRDEISFDTGRKRMSVQGKCIPLDEPGRTKLLTAQRRMAEQGLSDAENGRAGELILTV